MTKSYSQTIGYLYGLQDHVFLEFMDFYDETAPRNPFFEETNGNLGDLGLLMAMPWGINQFFPGNIIKAEAVRWYGNIPAAKTALFATAYINHIDFRITQSTGWASLAILAMSPLYADMAWRELVEDWDGLKRLRQVVNDYSDYFPCFTNMLTPEVRVYEQNLAVQQRRQTIALVK